MFICLIWFYTQASKTNPALTSPSYDTEIFKHELTAPTKQLLTDSLGQIEAAVQLENQTIAGCLQQRISQAQDKLHKQPQPLKAVQQAWDVFALLRSEARLGLADQSTKPKGRSAAV